MSVELREVAKTYPGTPPVHSLRGVSLRIGQGEQVAIVGASGSGKSTLLNLMAGLDRPSSGTVRIAGVDVDNLSDRMLSGVRAYQIGVIFQDFHLVESLTAVQNVATGLLYRGVPPARRTALALEVLEQVGLGDRGRHRPGALSGGERQRVAIARAIVGRPALLLADEPTGNLDSVTGADILALLRRLGDGGSTLIVVTHAADVAAAMTRRVEIRDGVIVTDTARAAR